MSAALSRYDIGDQAGDMTCTKAIIITKLRNQYSRFSNFIFFPSGTKTDLREDKETLAQLTQQGKSPFKKETGEKLATKIGAVKYMECSALTQKGLRPVSSKPTLCLWYSSVKQI